ncbi:PRTRC system protein C [Ramlibacter sp. AN1133]|uniref:PRTRC system protein C n=1 Tax=Ramlibacter sp. AN1133 TaxID=3133429 RepID=UPI0030C30289
MQEIQITRSFRYNSVTLPDPNPALDPEQIREFYAAQYPELNNAVVEGPVTSNAVATYTFIRAAGAKGASPKERTARDVIEATLSGADDCDAQALLHQAMEARRADASARIAQVASNTRTSAAPLPIPSAAFGLWG